MFSTNRDTGDAGREYQVIAALTQETTFGMENSSEMSEKVHLIFKATDDKLDDDIGEEISIENIDSEDLKQVAVAINKLSGATTIQPYEYKSHLEAISDNDRSSLMEENEDLKRKIILLEQKLNASERQIKSLEKLLVEDERQISSGRSAII